MKLLLGSAAIAGLAIVVPAMAADMAVKAPVPVYAPSWTGCYVGGNVGGGWGQNTGTRGIINAGNATLNAGVSVPVTLNTGSSGVVGGGQIGCNYQAGSIVLGAETDIQGSGIQGSSTVFIPSPDGGITDPSTSHGNERISWFGTARARLGFTLGDKLLLYGTGGLAYGGVKDSASFVLTPSGDGNYAGATSETKSGWTAGAGGEYAFNGNWSLRAEYLYVDLGSTAVRMFDPNRPGTFIDYSFQHRDNIVRVGLNYRFGRPFGAK